MSTLFGDEVNGLIEVSAPSLFPNFLHWHPVLHIRMFKSKTEILTFFVECTLAPR